MKKTLVALLMAATLVACGEAASPPQAGGGEDVVSHTPSPDDGSGPRTGGAQMVSPREGLVDVRPIGWNRAKALDDRTVALTFWHGIEECYGIDRVDVAYSDHAVTLTLFEGRNPEAETCIEIAVKKRIEVELEEAIDGRDLVDGIRS